MIRPRPFGPFAESPTTLICRSCGHAVEVTGPDVEPWANQVAAAHRYTGISYTLEIFGVCAPCANRSVSG